MLSLYLRVFAFISQSHTNSNNNNNDSFMTKRPISITRLMACRMSGCTHIHGYNIIVT